MSTSKASTLGYDWKQPHNSLESGTIPVSGSPSGVGQLAFACVRTVTDPRGITGVTPQVYWSGAAPGAGMMEMPVPA